MLLIVQDNATRRSGTARAWFVESRRSDVFFLPRHRLLFPLCRRQFHWSRLTDRRPGDFFGHALHVAILDSLVLLSSQVRSWCHRDQLCDPAGGIWRGHEIVADQEGRFRSLGHGLPRHACVRCAPGHLVGCCAFLGHRDLRIGEATNHHFVANSWNNHLPEHQAGEQRCIRSECFHRTDWVFDVLCQRLVHQGCPAYLRGNTSFWR
mmetsp:Transcript_58218/g.166998  ORF Transcript_58218/g.166998 Transcript_58218/m.166998 type:complete len:207 (+) Transcript_58218:372-992(+)